MREAVGDFQVTALQSVFENRTAFSKSVSSIFFSSLLEIVSPGEASAGDIKRSKCRREWRVPVAIVGSCCSWTTARSARRSGLQVWRGAVASCVVGPRSSSLAPLQAHLPCSQMTDRCVFCDCVEFQKNLRMTFRNTPSRYWLTS